MCVWGGHLYGLFPHDQRPCFIPVGFLWKGSVILRCFVARRGFFEAQLSIFSAISDWIDHLVLNSCRPWSSVGTAFLIDLTNVLLTYTTISYYKD